MGFNEDFAAYFSRILIGIELGLGVLILQPHYLKKLIVPGTFLMLVVFIIELAYEIVTGGNSGNCGCFGSLLPMTPLEADFNQVLV